VDRIMQYVRELRPSEDEQAQIELAVQEAVANAVVHGCAADRSQSVHCTVMAEADGSLTISVHDPGPGFDAGSLTSPFSEDGLASSHGRGILMIRQLMDEVSFAHNGAELIMRKR
jgi:anti-sigma regulatory factor (Ser/Thr protein kinase)